MLPRRLHPRTLAQAPELATLVGLEKLLFLATRVLVAEHATLSQPPPSSRRGEPATLREGRRVLGRITALQQALQRYEHAALDALTPAPLDDEELPF
jgi:hypothetical protein